MNDVFKDPSRTLFCNLCGGYVTTSHEELKMTCSDCGTEMKWCDVLTPDEFRFSVEGSLFNDIFDNLVELLRSRTDKEESEIEIIVANSMYDWMRSLDKEVGLL